MDLGAVLLHLEAQRRADALRGQRDEERRIEQLQNNEDRWADRQAAEERAAQAVLRRIHAIRPNLLRLWRRTIRHYQQMAVMWSAAP